MRLWHSVAAITRSSSVPATQTEVGARVGFGDGLEVGPGVGSELVGTGVGAGVGLAVGAGVGLVVVGAEVVGRAEVGLGVGDG